MASGTFQWDGCESLVCIRASKGCDGSTIGTPLLCSERIAFSFIESVMGAVTSVSLEASELWQEATFANIARYGANLGVRRSSRIAVSSWEATKLSK